MTTPVALNLLGDAQAAQFCDTLGLSDILGMMALGCGVVFDIYVDSINGSDLNNGTSASKAFATLAAAQTAATAIGNGVKIGLAAGAVWRENLVLSTLTGVIVSGYGDFASAGLPSVRGDDVVSGAWSDSVARADAYTNTYSIAYTHGITGTANLDRPVLFCDGVQLNFLANAAAVDAAAGSYYCASGSPTTLYVHPPGSTNPNTDSKVYEATQREKVLSLGAGGTVRYVRARRAGHPDGAITAGASSYVYRCLFDDAIVHGGLLASGVFRECVAWRQAAKAPPSSSWPAILLEFYTANATGLTGEFDKCIAMSDVGIATYAVVGIGGHSTGAYKYDSMTATDCAGKDVYLNAATCTDAFFTRCHGQNILFGPAATNYTYTDCQVINTADMPANTRIWAPGGAGVVSFTLNGCRVHQGYDSLIFYGGQAGTILNITRSVFNMPATYATSQYIVNSITDNAANVYNYTGDIWAFNPTNASAAYMECVSDNLTLDNNVYYSATNKLYIISQATATQRLIGAHLTAMQAIGLELNSVNSNPGFTDPANGDWSMSLTPPANCGLERPNISYTPLPANVAAAEAWIIGL